MRKALLVFVAALCLGPVAGWAKITCVPPSYFVGILDTITIFDPQGVKWTISPWPFLPCDDPGANCVDIWCATGNCQEEEVGDCFSFLTSRCSNDPETYIRRAFPADPSLCSVPASED